VFLSCCHVFLKCSLHLYHANQFVVIMIMIIISCIRLVDMLNNITPDHATNKH